MKKSYSLLIVFVCSIIFTVFFYKKDLGLNLFLFEWIVFIGLVASGQFKPRGKNGITVSVLYIVSSVGTIITHSLYCYIINIIVFFFFIGFVAYPQAKSYLSSAGIAFNNLFNAQRKFTEAFSTFQVKGFSASKIVWYIRVFIFPIAIILVFIVLYRLSNPVFDSLLRSAMEYIDEYVFHIFSYIDILVIFTFFIGLFINNFIWFRTAVDAIIKRDNNAAGLLVRKRFPQVFTGKHDGLKNEYKAAVFLLATLNLIILVLNCIDIKWIWFNSTESQYLMQFVHEGTYLLISSVLISIAIVLFYFRRNLNFYTRNKPLKILSYIWLAQNAIMVISVAVRNYRYVEHYALAYKRIGVFIFLMMVLYGLYTVFIKVKLRKSSFYLFNANSYAMIIVLVASSVINWDIIIAEYNFSNGQLADIHLNYMANLSDTALDKLDLPLDKVKQMNIFDKTEYRGYYSPEEYCRDIESQKHNFIYRWEHKSWLEWNWAEYRVYNALKK